MHLSTWTIESAEERSERILHYRSELSIRLRLRPHTYNSNIFNVYVTQDKSRIELFDTTTLYLLIVRASLPHIFPCSMNGNHQAKNTVSAYNHEHHGCEESWSSTEDRNIVCIEYRQRRAGQGRCIAKKQHRHAARVYSSVTR